MKSRAAVQKNVHKLENQANRYLIKYNKGKSSVLHLLQCGLEKDWVGISLAENHLCVLAEKQLIRS